MELLRPQNGVSHSHMNTTVTVLKHMFHTQKDKRINVYDKSYVFGCYTKWVVDKAQKRKQIQDKLNYVKKMDHNSSHIQCLGDHQEDQEQYHKEVKNFVTCTLFSSL